MQPYPTPSGHARNCSTSARPATRPGPAYAGRLARAIRALGSARFRDRLGRMLFRDLFRRSHATAGRACGRAQTWPRFRTAGDASILKQFLLYRTYHGATLSPMFQAASVVAWNEAHVRDNRALYLKKFTTVTPMLADVLDVRLYADYNDVAVLPGSFVLSGTRRPWHESRQRFHPYRAGRGCLRMRGRCPAHRRILPHAGAVNPSLITALT